MKQYTVGSGINDISVSPQDFRCLASTTPIIDFVLFSATKQPQLLVNQAQRLVNEAQLLVNESQILMNEAQRLVNEAQRLVNDAQRLMNEAQLLVNEAKTHIPQLFYPTR